MKIHFEHRVGKHDPEYWISPWHLWRDRPTAARCCACYITFLFCLGLGILAGIKKSKKKKEKREIFKGGGMVQSKIMFLVGFFPRLSQPFQGHFDKVNVFSTWQLFHESLDRVKTILIKNQYPAPLFEKIIHDNLTPRSMRLGGENKSHIMIFLQYRRKCIEAHARDIHKLPKKNCNLFSGFNLCMKIQCPHITMCVMSARLADIYKIDLESISGKTHWKCI